MIQDMEDRFRQKFLRDFDECFDEPIISKARSSSQYLESTVRDDSLEADKKTLPFACDLKTHNNKAQHSRQEQCQYNLRDHFMTTQSSLKRHRVPRRV